MGRGRAPCCDKSQVKRGPWSPAEDLRLITFIQKHGHDNWRALPKQAGLLRCGKSCRLRWINYLRPDLKRGNFTPEEEETIIKLHQTIGKKWSKIASHLPGRTDNEIKNVWNTHLKKRLDKKVVTDSNNESSSITSSSSSSTESCKDPQNVNVNQNLDMVIPLDQNSPNNEAKEQSSSSSTSYNTLVSNSNQLDVAMCEELMDSLFDFTDLNNQVPNASKEGTNDYETIMINALEFPLDSDFNIWELLDDNSGSFQSSNQTQQPPVDKVIQSSSDVVHEEEVHSMTWLKYIENELGLETTGDNEKTENALTRQDASNELGATILKKDVDPAGINSFQSWSPSPQYFLIQ